MLLSHRHDYRDKLKPTGGIGIHKRRNSVSENIKSNENRFLKPENIKTLPEERKRCKNHKKI